MTHDDRLYWLMRAAHLAERMDFPPAPDEGAEYDHIARMLGDDTGCAFDQFSTVPRRAGEPLVEYATRAESEYRASVEADLQADHRRDGRPGESFDDFLDRCLAELGQEIGP